MKILLRYSLLIIFLFQSFSMISQVNSKWGIINTRQMQGGGLYHDQYNQEANETFGFEWFHDYYPENKDEFFPNTNRLYTVWRPTANHTPSQIQQWASDAREYMGSKPVFWVIANEPNLSGQADITPEDYAILYKKFHENLKIGDPNCKILGPALFANPGFYDWGDEFNYPAPKQWYEAFRNYWKNTPSLRSYSRVVNETDYPPLDAFNIHLYYRNVDETSNVFDKIHADIVNYPEIADKKISITEIGDLGWLDSPAADFANDLIDWSIGEDRLERAYWFFMHEDQSQDWPNTILIDESDNITEVGQVFIDRFVDQNQSQEAKMISPLSDSDLDQTTTFTWTKGDEDIEVWVPYIGTFVGGNDIYDGGFIPQGDQATISRTVSSSSFTTDKVYVRLWHRYANNQWRYLDYEYNLSLDDEVHMISPVDGSDINSPTKFVWTGAEESSEIFGWYLYVGTTAGYNNVANSGWVYDNNLASHSLRVSNSALDENIIYVRIWYYLFSNKWKFKDYVYNLSNGNLQADESNKSNSISSKILPPKLPKELRNIKIKHDFSVFPNPVRSDKDLVVSFDSEILDAIEITIVDETGKLIKSFHSNGPLKQLNLDVQDFKPGVYFLNIQDVKKLQELKSKTFIVH